MMYLLYGSDIEKSRAKLHDLVASLLKKKPDASHIRMSDEGFDEAHLDEHISGMGLFSQKTIVEMDNVFRNKEAKEIIMGRIKDIGASENIFVFLEGELTKADLAKFEKHSEKVQLFEIKKTAQDSYGKKEEFKIFSLTDALGRRDKKQLWVLYQKAKMNNASPEEIHGILFWQIKSILLALQSKNAQDAGLNPYVYQKSKGFSQNFTPEELTTISSHLVSMYHDARRGMTPFDTALEKFILEV